MKFAKYWVKEDVCAESLFGHHSVSVWGASNESEQEARLNAEARKEQLLSFAENGFSRKDEYEYTNGYIREDIIEEITASDGCRLGVVTRNRYGALVLNTENVVFGDIDIQSTKSRSGLFGWFKKKKQTKDTAYYLAQIEAYQKANPEVSFKVYKTHSGMRFILTNQNYQPSDAVVVSMFKELDVDPLYVRLCHQQSCFRARLSPKPWRVGMQRASAGYPLENVEQDRILREWIKQYETSSKQYAVVEHLASFGDSQSTDEIQRIVEFHDRLALKSSASLA